MSASLEALLQRWRAIFHRRRAVRWRGTWLENGYCADCRLCCGPQEEAEPFPMKLLPAQLGSHLEEDFYLLDATTACLDRRGCRSCTDTGCRLPRSRRPVACGLFPFVLNKNSLLLFARCPASFFTPLSHMELVGRDAARWLASLPREDRARIALDLPPATLADRYLNLHMRIPDDSTS
ncbi:MAG: hypothetical protein IJU37_11240 [Desulfovibrio sp.]|nr:hypothetical protein [Desulfovibrio sp.]